MEYTPGPLEVRSFDGVWSVHQVSSLAVTALCPEGFVAGVKDIGADEALANANLYAASPDLLAACKHAALFIDGKGYLADERAERKSVASEIRAAVAKAAGRVQNAYRDVE